MERGRYGRGRRGGDFGERGRRGGDFGGRGRGRGDFGRGGGRSGGGMAETKEVGLAANERALQGLAISVTPHERLTPETLKLSSRPDRGGRAGKGIEVMANFFQMRTTIQTVHQYDVVIRQKDSRQLSEGDEPVEGQQILPINLSRAIVDACASHNQWPRGWVYDGKKNIFSSTETFPRNRINFEIDLSEGGPRPRIFEVIVQWVSAINMSDIRRFFERKDIEVPRNALMCLEVCLKFSATQKPECHIAGRSVFFNDPRTNQSLTRGSELWMGYSQGAKICQAGLLMNLETTSTAFMTGRPVIEHMEEAVGRRITELHRMDIGIWTALKKSVLNISIITNHRRVEGRRKKHRVRGLTEHGADKEIFTMKDGTQQTVAAYWQQKYGPLRYPWFPCLDVGRGKKVNYLPAEVCDIAPGQRIQTLTPDMTRSLIRFTATRPENRQNQIMEAFHQINVMNDPAARAFGIEVRPDLLKVPGRILPQPHLEYQVPASMDTGDRGAWNLDRVKFFRPKEIHSWAIVSMVDRRISLQPGEQGLQAFVGGLIQMLKNMGIHVASGMPPLVHRENKTTEQTLQAAMQEAESQYQEHPDIILVLLAKKGSSLKILILQDFLELGPYAEVKRIAERDLGITTQCFVCQSAGIGSQPKGRLQYLANLGMKINHKLGGINTHITGSLMKSFPILGSGRNKPFIVFGADVTHPTSFDVTEPSVGAIVASMDPHMGQFSTRVMTMGHREETMAMSDAMVDLFNQFFTTNGVRPEAVFYYRDGVSEGQFQSVLQQEYFEIKKACHKLSPQYNPPITIVIVQKMHHTRLFPTNSQDADRNGNVKPGTCVDLGITSIDGFDFYLNSHAGIQGTNKPAHYHVLVDENGFGSDGIQMFSYWLCYLYCRCTRSVSYVPPAYYAHLAAQHGKYLVSANSDSSSPESNGRNSLFHQNLDNKMFFV